MRAHAAAALLLAALLAAGAPGAHAGLAADAAPVPGRAVDSHCPPSPPHAFLICFAEEIVCSDLPWLCS